MTTHQAAPDAADLPDVAPTRKRHRDGTCNQKGGAGKTTTAVSLCAEQARRGKRVRLHDMDSQDGSATHWLSPQWNDATPDERYDISHVLAGRCTIDEASWPTVVPGLYIVPSFQTLTGWANSNPVGGESALRAAIDESEMEFDLEMVDCPPSLGLLTIASLTAVDRLLVPLRASGLDFAGVAELKRTLALVRKRLNPGLDVAAIVLCGKLESKLVGAVIDQLRKDFPQAFTEEIRNTVRMQEAPFQHVPIHMHAPGCTADEDYRNLAALLYGEEGAA